MKIGIFTYDFYPFIGGQGRNIFNIFKYLRNKAEVQVFSPVKNNIKENRRIFGFSRRFGRNLLFSFLLNLNIKRVIKNYNLDLAIFQGGPGGVFMLRKLPIKQEYIANHTYYQQTEYIKSQFWKKVFIPFEKKGYKNSDTIRSISESTKKVLIEKYNLLARKIYIKHPKAEKIFKKIKKIKKIPKSLLYVGRLDKRKGIDFLIKTMPDVVKEIPGIKLFIIGKGKLRKRLEKYVNKKGLGENVKFLGFVPDKELPKWYNRCKLTVIPSIFEGFGITAIESLACGTSVIATNSDGLRDIIKDKKCLFKFGDKRDLFKKIKRGVLNEG
jgi:glycosyltransferase involved in cell wall biosynthesis